MLDCLSLLHLLQSLTDGRKFILLLARQIDVGLLPGTRMGDVEIARRRELLLTQLTPKSFGLTEKTLKGRKTGKKRGKEMISMIDRMWKEDFVQ